MVEHLKFPHEMGIESMISIYITRKCPKLHDYSLVEAVKIIVLTILED